VREDGGGGRGREVEEEGGREVEQDKGGREVRREGGEEGGR
jgi:hypothetical protein